MGTRSERRAAFVTMPQEISECGWGERDAGSLRARLRPLIRTVREVLASIDAAVISVGADAPRGEVLVHYGYRDLPGPDMVAVGGLVKLQALSSAFPNTRRRFSVLYLVSSRLPDGAVALARAAKRKRVRVVINQNGVAYPGWYGRGWEAVNEPMTELLQIADHVFYQSEFCRMAADEFLRAWPTSWETLYNAVDTSFFSPAGPRRERAGLTLLLAGSQDKSYRVGTALEVLRRVARRHPDVGLIVTGRLGWGQSFDEARRMALEQARTLGVEDRVSFTGPYRQAEAPDIFRRADLLLHTKPNDPSPTVVLEAMACSLPVVYSATGGVPELVGSDAGVGVPGEVRWDREMPPDPDALAAAVLTVVERHEQYSEAARQRALDRFDLRAWVQRHAEVFERLVA